MAKYKLSNVAKEDLIRIHHYGIKRFVLAQADKYFDTFFEYFNIIAKRPYSVESVEYIRNTYRRYVCGVDSIFYRIENEIVEIMSIIGRQELNDVLNN